MTPLSKKTYTGPGNIHMIHLNNESWLNIYDYNIATWKNLYKDCDFKVWGFEDVKDIIEQSEWCKKFYQIFLNEKSFYPLALMSDYIRLYILNKYGGLYVDTDVFALNRMPENIFKSKMALAWDPGIRTKNYTSDYIKKHNIEKTGDVFFWREYKIPIINNGSFFFSKEENPILVQEMNIRDDFAKNRFNPEGFHCLSLIETLKKFINLNEEEEYQKVLYKNDILILNSNYNAFEPEESYFDYNKSEPIYNVHQCLLTGYNGPPENLITVSDFSVVFNLFKERKFIKHQMILIPINSDLIEEFNDFSFTLR